MSTHDETLGTITRNETGRVVVRLGSEEIGADVVATGLVDVQALSAAAGAIRLCATAWCSAREGKASVFLLCNAQALAGELSEWVTVTVGGTPVEKAWLEAATEAELIARFAGDVAPERGAVA